MKIRCAMIGAATLLLTACAVDVSGPVDPYYYSPTYCAGCWYGEWGGRSGYHRGGGRQWEREHVERDHHFQDRGRDDRHDGHR